MVCIHESGYQISQKFEIPEEDGPIEVRSECDEFPSVKNLRILCRSKDEVFTFKYASACCCKESEHTKRSFLKNIVTLFDPLGFLSTYAVLGKVLLEELWMTRSD